MEAKSSPDAMSESEFDAAMSLPCFESSPDAMSESEFEASIMSLPSFDAMSESEFDAAMSLPCFESSFVPQMFEGSKGSNDCNGNNTGQSIRKGRPLGSRNKPKENPIVYRDSIDTMMPHLINVEAGADIVQCLHRLYKSLQVEGLYLMSAIGTVADVTISIAGSLKRLSGIFQILSLSGSYLPFGSSLSITLLDGKHKVFAGAVQGILRAAGPVDIVAGSCGNASVLIARPISHSAQGDDNAGYAASGSSSVEDADALTNAVV